MTFFLGPKETGQLSSLDHREKLVLSSSPPSFSVSEKTRKMISFSPFCPFCSNLILKLREWPTSCHVSNLARVGLYPETIYSISVQGHIIFHQLNLTYFPKSCFWAVLDTRCLEIHENSIVSEFNEIRFGK